MRFSSFSNVLGLVYLLLSLLFYRLPRWITHTLTTYVYIHYNYGDEKFLGTTFLDVFSWCWMTTPCDRPDHADHSTGVGVPCRSHWFRLSRVYRRRPVQTTLVGCREPSVKRTSIHQVTSMATTLSCFKLFIFLMLFRQLTSS